MPTPEQKKKLLKAKIAVALQNELGRVPKDEEINQVFLMARVMYKAILGLHFKRQEQKKNCLSATFRLEFSARCDKMLPSNREGIACCRPIFRPTCQASRRGSAQTSSVGAIFSRRAGRKVSVARAAAMSTPIVTRSV